MEVNLKGKTALVCGATQGIGRAIAQDFAGLGASVILLARNEKELQDLIQKLPQPQKHQYICVDLNQRDHLKDKIEAFLKTRPIDILINNSSGPNPGAISEANINELILAFNQHVLAAQQLALLVLPQMKKNNFGRIINIVSISVKCPIQGLGVSNTIRGAMASWSKTLASEVAAFGITVNCILPGYTNTSRLKSLIEYKAKLNQRTHADEEIIWRNEVPAKRFAEPVEVANLASYLSSARASYITGTAIPIDGGKNPSL